MPSSRGSVVDLTTRAGFRPDLSALARQQIAAARERLEASPAQFADLLAAVLDWSPSAEAVEAWETSATPPGDVLVAAGLLTRNQMTSDTTDVVAAMIGDRYADVTAVYPDRASFAAAVPPSVLFDEATQIDMSGISLNYLCQAYPMPSIRRLLMQGTILRCLFLDPSGESNTAREREEGWQPGQLAALTALNIATLTSRVRAGLPAEAADRLQIRTSDETVRFNLIIVDGGLCVMQPYMPATRGGDSPTFVIQRKANAAQLFTTFSQLFGAMWARGTAVP